MKNKTEREQDGILYCLLCKCIIFDLKFARECVFTQNKITGELFM